MKRIYAGFLLVAAIAIISGCNQGTPGGPGTSETSPTKPPAVGQVNDTFNLSAPLLPTSLKQGERIATSIGIKRGKDFDEEVTVKFTGLPKGVQLDPSPALIKHGDEEAKLTLIAAKDASLGDFTINVTGHPSKGADASIVFKVTVVKK